MTSSTFWRVLGRMLGLSLSTRETVWYETPARAATSRMLGARTLSMSGFTVAPSLCDRAM